MFNSPPPAMRGDIKDLTFTAPVLDGPKVTHHLAISRKFRLTIGKDLITRPI